MSVDRGDLPTWMAELAAALGVDPATMNAAALHSLVTPVLDLARDAAHHVARPAAPLSTFLAGYAAGLNGGGPEAVADALARATTLALAHDTIES